MNFQLLSRRRGSGLYLRRTKDVLSDLPAVALQTVYITSHVTYVFRECEWRWGLSWCSSWQRWAAVRLKAETWPDVSWGMNWRRRSVACRRKWSRKDCLWMSWWHTVSTTLHMGNILLGQVRNRKKCFPGLQINLMGFMTFMCIYLICATRHNWVYKRVCSVRKRRLTGSQLAASVNVTSGLNVCREEATPGCWPSRQSSTEISKSETDQSQDKRFRWDRNTDDGQKKTRRWRTNLITKKNVCETAE